MLPGRPRLRDGSQEMTKVSVTPMDANKIVEENLDVHLDEVEKQTGGDALAFAPWANFAKFSR